MKQAIATVKKTKEIQEKYNVFTKKSFGQNFIIEPGVVEKIANAAIQSRDELVFEIGPGIGALTQFLCEKSDQVVAFEIDERLPVVLENEIGFDHLQIVLMKRFVNSENLGKRLCSHQIFLTTLQRQFYLSCLRQMKRLKELQL